MRSRREAPYLDRLERELGGAMRTYAADEGDRLDVQALLAHAHRETQVYACGPRRLIEAVHGAAQAAGLDESNVHVERFLPGPSRGGAQELTVTLHRSGKRLWVGPAQSILQAVEEAGVEAAAGCRGGTCGQCAVKVLSGTPDHQDQVLTDTERQEGLICTCVSRALGTELTLDL